MGLFNSIEATAANAVLPGSGIIVKLWCLIKPLLPYLAIVAGVVVLLLFVDHRGYRRGVADKVAKYQPVLDRALHREQIAIKSLTGADNAIRRQNASILRLAKAEADKLAVAQRAIADAHKLAAARNVVIANLRASAAKPIPGTPCEASAATKESW